jgi:hypothetical protein
MSEQVAVFEPSLVSADEARMLVRRKEVMKLLKQGVRKQTEIAAILKVDTKTVRRDLNAIEKEYSEFAQKMQGIRDMEKMLAWERYQEVMAEMADVRMEMMDVIRAEDRRLDEKLRASEAHARAGESFMKSQDRINKLLGLNAPTKHSLTDPTGEQERSGMNDDLRKKILEERREIEEIRLREEENTVDAEIVDESYSDAYDSRGGEEDEEESGEELLPAMGGERVQGESEPEDAEGNHAEATQSKGGFDAIGTGENDPDYAANG